MKKIKGVLFDMDGVILDSERGAFSLLQKTLRYMGVVVTAEELLEYVGRHTTDIAESLIQRFNLKMTAEEFQAKNRKTGNYYADSELTPMEGLVDLLIYLKAQGVKTGVVSSTRSPNVLTALNRMHLLTYFDVLVCGDMVTEVKPSPEGYLKAVALLGVEKEGCLIIEDSPIGIQAGKNAYITVIGYKGTEIKQDTSQADIEVHSFAEIRNEIQLWNSK